MKVIIHDLGSEYEALVEEKSDRAVAADGKYAPCQGCFGCWTRHPAECFMKDKLQQICRVIGQADELVIVTKNLYGAYSAAVKNVLDRSIGTSTPLSTYRGRQMHHTLRYGKHDLGQNSAARKYTRILIPSFIFIVFADIFFIIISIFEGGIFRGWLAKKQ